MSLEKQNLIEENLQKAFNEDSFKQTLSAVDFQKYLDAKEILSFQKGDVIFEDGDTPKGVFFIRKGTAKLSKQGIRVHKSLACSALAKPATSTP